MDGAATAEGFSRVIVEPADKAVSAAIERAILHGALPPGSAVGRATRKHGPMPAREPIGLLYRPTLLQLLRHLPQAKVRRPAAQRHLVDTRTHRRFSTRQQET